MERKIPDSERVVLIFPAYDPPELFIDIADTLADREDLLLLVIDDGSHADYENVFAQMPESATVLRHEKNRGKGAAVKTALRYLIDEKISCAGAVIVDCDGKHRPQFVLKMADSVRSGTGGLLMGARRFNKKVPGLLRFGNRITRWVYYSKTGLRLTDTQTGLRGFGAELFKELSELDGERYEYEINMLLWAAEQKIPVKEIPIEVDYTGLNPFRHFHLIRDSVRIYAKLLRFTVVSFASFLVDYAAVMLLDLAVISLPERIALLISVVGARIVSGTFSFVMNRFVVFKVKNNLAKAIGEFVLLAAILLVANYVLLDLLTIIAPMPLWLAKPLADSFLFVVNYFAMNKFVFKKKARRKDAPPVEEKNDA